MSFEVNLYLKVQYLKLQCNLRQKPMRIFKQTQKVGCFIPLSIKLVYIKVV